MTRSRKLTQEVVDAATPRVKEYLLSDDQVVGLYLRVRPNASRTWQMRWADGKATRKASLGSATTITLEAARRRAVEPGGVSVAHRADRAATRSAPGEFGRVARLYLETKERDGLKSKSYRTYIRSQLIPNFGDLAITDLSTPRVAHWFHSYSSTRPGGANEAIKILGFILRFARDRGINDAQTPDPCAAIQRNPRRHAWRILGAEGLAALGKALDQADPSDADAVDAIRLILLTGCRSGEIRKLRWTEVRADRLQLEDSKTGPRPVILSSQAKALLARRHEGRLSAFVFPSKLSLNRPVCDFSLAWKRIRAAAGLDQNLRLHDLRHSYASHAVMRGESLAITGRLLGHKGPLSTERYAHYDGRHLSAAARRVCASIAEAMA